MSIVFRNIGAIFLSLLMHLYFYGSDHIKKFDYDYYDVVTMLSNKVDSSEDAFYTVIVDIDEKSLLELGQWPWPRVIDAKLIDILHDMNPSAIGINILFPEEDRVSPIYIQNFYKKFFNLDVKFRDFPEQLKDNDKLLASSIKSAGATIATSYFKNSSERLSSCENISYKENMFSAIETPYEAFSLLCNHESIQSGVENFGFGNAWRDGDGIFRRVPLFMRYSQEVFPSFALATLLSFDEHIKREEDTILVNFSPKEPKVFSAIDLLYGNVPASEIQGKIVIVGSSVAGLTPKYMTSNGKEITNNMIQAFVIDNILSDSFLVQPEIYKKINILLSFVFSLFIIFFLSRKAYLYIIALFIFVIVGSSIWLLIRYLDGVYISIAYLWIPLLYFIMAILLYHLRVINAENQQQEKILIRQSKLASMGEMITLIAHQWRQPLSVINGIVLNIDIDQRKKLLDSGRLDNHLNKIEETTAYLSKTINDFTDFFSRNKGKDSFYISTIIEQAKQLSGASSNKDVSIVHSGKKDIKVLGYQSELTQSLLIILNNAIYASQKNTLSKGEGVIIINTQVENEMLLISVEDDGGGIEYKDIKKIFDPYFTTKDKAHGTGLGLYILKLIVEDSMNGKVGVYNGENGAIFTIQIPLAI